MASNQFLSMPLASSRPASVAVGSRSAHVREPTRTRIGRRDLAFVLHNLATLLSNGVSLPRSLDTLTRERSLRRHAPLINAIRLKLESGEAFSATLAAFPQSFTEIVISQIRGGEKAGDLAHTLERVASQLENASTIRANVIRKLSYPAVLLAAGTAAVTFMLLFVIPVFEQTYEEAHVPLPGVTRALMATGDYAVAYGWLIPLIAATVAITVRRLRQKAKFAIWMDRAVLQLPILGDWLRNIAVLQFVNVFGNLLESGFKLVEALDASVGSVGNRAIRQSVSELKTAVTQGERFGSELARFGGLFPPVVSQLIAVGETTGNLAPATSDIRRHLEREVERQTNILVGTIEPVLTISMAAAIAVILLAIYLPMFDMIGAVGRA